MKIKLKDFFTFKSKNTKYVHSLIILSLNFLYIFFGLNEALLGFYHVKIP